jgi:hypothetical protein
VQLKFIFGESSVELDSLLPVRNFAVVQRQPQKNPSDCCDDVIEFASMMLEDALWLLLQMQLEPSPAPLVELATYDWLRTTGSCRDRLDSDR